MTISNGIRMITARNQAGSKLLNEKMILNTDRNFDKDVMLKESQDEEQQD